MEGKIKLIILSEEQIKQNYGMKDAYADIRKGIIAMQKGEIINPFRTVLDFPEYDGSALYMPSADFSEQTTATKVVTIFPQNPQVNKPTTQGVLLLSDATNGEHVCLMNASYLTRLRTGALSAVGTAKLAREDAKVLGAIGTGGMAFEQVLGVLEVRDIEKIILFNRTTKKAHDFKEKLIDFGVMQEIEVLDNVDELVENADVINCATRSETPVFNGDFLRPGTHINGVGSFLPHMREVDQTTIEKTDFIVVDDLHGVREEAGEFIHADKNSDWSFDDIYGELQALEMDDNLLRNSEQQITFFKSVGAAYFDLIVANGTYNKVKNSNIGQPVEL